MLSVIGSTRRDSSPFRTRRIERLDGGRDRKYMKYAHAEFGWPPPGVDRERSC